MSAWGDYYLPCTRLTVDIILGRLWHLYSSEVRWEPCEVTCWSMSCHRNCLTALPLLLPRPLKAWVTSTQVESLEPQETPTVSSEYAAFQDVFSKQAATLLPLHQPWDCVIDLLPWAKLSKGRVYPLSILELKAMEDYIRDSSNHSPPRQPQASSSWARRTEGIHRLPHAEFPDGEAAISTSPGPSRPWGTLWSPRFLQTGPAERIQPRSNPVRWWVEDCVHHPCGPL